MPYGDLNDEVLRYECPDDISDYKRITSPNYPTLDLTRTLVAYKEAIVE